MSSFLAKLVRSEKSVPKKDHVGMPSTDDLATSLLRLRDDALQIHNDYRDSTNDFEGRIARVSTQISTLYPIINTIYRAFLDKSSRAAVLEREIDTVSKSLQSATEDLQDHKARLSERMGEIDMLVQERQQLRGEVERYEKEAEENRRSYEATEFELQARERRIKELDARLVDLADDKTKRDNAYFDAKRTIARLTNDLGEVRLTLEARNSSLDTLKASMADDEASRARMNAELIRSTNECQSLRGQLGHLEKEHQAARRRYDAQIKRLSVKASELDRDRDALRSRLSVNEKLNRSQRVKLERAHEYIGYLQATLRRMTDDKQADVPLGINFDYDFDINDAQLAGLHQAEMLAAKAAEPSGDDEKPTDNLGGSPDVIKLRPRQRK